MRFLKKWHDEFMAQVFANMLGGVLLALNPPIDETYSLCVGEMR